MCDAHATMATGNSKKPNEKRQYMCDDCSLKIQARQCCFNVCPVLLFIAIFCFVVVVLGSSGSSGSGPELEDEF